MDSILNILSEDMIYALGWTVIHSLWQASLIALLMSYLVNRYQNKSSILRYRIAAMSLFAVLVTSLATFIIYYDMSSVSTIMANSTAGTIADSSSSGSSYSIFSSIAGFFENNMVIIVWTWLLGCALFLVKLVGGIVYLKSLINTGNPIENNAILKRFNDLTRRIKFSRKILLLESAKIQTPMMLGHLKPVILFPIGLINKLEIEEVEAILAHEISHIFRNDYLVNIIQSLVEVLFYYHPAVWWISANIKSERENCCDDLALRICGNKLKYASALIKLKEIEINNIPSLAIPFSSNNENLFNRIKRIFDQPQNKSHLKEKLVMIAFLLSSVILFSFGKKQLTVATETEICEEKEIVVTHISNEGEEASINVEVVVDTIPKKKSKITIEKDDGNKNIVLKMEDGKVEYMEIDGEVIPKEDYKKHMKVIDELRPMKAHDGLLHSFDFSHDYPAIIYSDSVVFDDFNKVFKYYGDSVLVDIKSDKFKYDSLLHKFDFDNSNLAFEFYNKARDQFHDNIFVLPDSLGEFEWYDHDTKWPEHLLHSDSIYSILKDSKLNDFLIKRYVPSIKADSIWLHMGENHFYDELIDSSHNNIFAYPRIKIEKDMQPFLHSDRRNKGDNGSYRSWFGQSVQQKILSEMHRDGLIDDSDKEYEIELSGKHLKIDGKKMPKELWQKYKKIYENTQGVELNKKSKIVFKSKIGDHKRLRIRTI